MVTSRSPDIALSQGYHRYPSSTKTKARPRLCSDGTFNQMFAQLDRSAGYVTAVPETAKGASKARDIQRMTSMNDPIIFNECTSSKRFSRIRLQSWSPVSLYEGRVSCAAWIKMGARTQRNGYPSAFLDCPRPWLQPTSVRCNWGHLAGSSRFAFVFTPFRTLPEIDERLSRTWIQAMAIGSQANGNCHELRVHAGQR